ncbi:uncharacterized protein COLE_06967 [Cutaneotrichosporon oleaginosum]|uniref:uncharacterized protein n=1 Tax=Cutaneotrichosporon oleaginosum TaxID=879819 RepID=UPI0013276256|nr:hypothetical protein COLE_06967 [Cutaneotrichosporon oleaginosum]
MARPTRAAAAAAAAKRARSSSLSATDAESTPPPPKKAAKKAATSKASAASSKSLTKTTPSRKSIAKFPPAGLEAPYPARLGLPVFVSASAAPLVTPPGAFAPQVNGGLLSAVDAAARPLLIGAHVSMAGGPATALLRSAKLGANGLALFVKGHRTWKSKPMEEEAIEKFREIIKPEAEGGMGYGPESILVHGNYLINLGTDRRSKRNVAYECFRDDLERCHKLGIKLYNWHPGSTVGACSKEESFALVAKAINRVHKEVPEVITVIENMANAGSNILGTAFADLASMIALVEDKSRVRVCLDTCHTFAAGYDLRTPETYAATMDDFDKIVGFQYLAGIHLNDSKAPLGGNRDLHENIGLGEIGLTGFRELVRDPRMAGIPMVLETPSGPEDGVMSEIWAKEVALFYEIQGVSDGEWESKKVEIETRWRKERDAISPPKAKPAKKTPSKAKGRSKKKESESEAEDSE